jgi:hypothetical protein
MVAVRQYVTLLYRRTTFVLGLASVFVMAGLLIIAAHNESFLRNETSRHLAAGLGEALIIAVLLAVLVDPVVQHKFATEWGRDLYWAIFSPQAPQEFRDALQALAAPAGYIQSCEYELVFRYPKDGADTFLEVDWQVSLWGVTLERRGFQISDPVFVVSRHDGTPSRYTHWSFRSEGADSVDYNETELTALGVMSIDGSGRTILHQQKIPGVGKVGFSRSYWSERKLHTSRWRADFLPMFQPRIALKQTITLKGEPISELEFSVTQLGRDSMPLVETTRPDGTIELKCTLDSVAFPGQATLVSWKPSVTSERRVELPSEQVEAKTGSE